MQMDYIHKLKGIWWHSEYKTKQNQTSVYIAYNKITLRSSKD
jgi:hypothetical protein